MMNYIATVVVLSVPVSWTCVHLALPLLRRSEGGTTAPLAMASAAAFLICVIAAVWAALGRASVSAALLALFWAIASAALVIVLKVADDAGLSPASAARPPARWMTRYRAHAALVRGTRRMKGLALSAAGVVRASVVGLARAATRATGATARAATRAAHVIAGAATRAAHHRSQRRREHTAAVHTHQLEVAAAHDGQRAHDAPPAPAAPPAQEAPIAAREVHHITGVTGADIESQLTSVIAELCRADVVRDPDRRRRLIELQRYLHAMQTAQAASAANSGVDPNSVERYYTQRTDRLNALLGRELTDDSRT